MLRFATRFPLIFAVLVVSAALFALAAVNHVVLAVRHDGDVPRHWVFAGIDLAAALVVASKRRWAIYPIAALALQQAWSHGSDFVRDGDLTSLGVLVFFPILLVTLVVERRPRTGDRRARRRGGRRRSRGTRRGAP
jgi:hypothetical protein